MYRDAEVAEKVMGLCVHRPFWNKSPMDYYNCPCGMTIFKEMIEDQSWARPYTTQIAVAWEIVEKEPEFSRSYTTAGFSLERKPNLMDGKWFCVIDMVLPGKTHPNGENVWATADSAPEAICIAALRAKGFEVQT